MGHQYILRFLIFLIILFVKSKNQWLDSELNSAPANKFGHADGSATMIERKMLENGGPVRQTIQLFWQSRLILTFRFSICILCNRLPETSQTWAAWGRG